MVGKKSIIDIVLVVLVGGLFIVSVGTLLAFWITYWNDLFFYVVLLLWFCVVASIYIGLWTENHKDEIDAILKEEFGERRF